MIETLLPATSWQCRMIGKNYSVHPPCGDSSAFDLLDNSQSRNESDGFGVDGGVPTSRGSWIDWGSGSTTDRRMMPTSTVLAMACLDHWERVAVSNNAT